MKSKSCIVFTKVNSADIKKRAQAELISIMTDYKKNCIKINILNPFYIEVIRVTFFFFSYPTLAIKIFW